MKKRQNIDEFFRSGISGFKADPSGKVWDNIESAYFAKERIVSRWFYIGAALLFLLLLAGGIWYFSVQNESQQINTKNQVSESKNTMEESREPEISPVENPGQMQKQEIITPETESVGSVNETAASAKNSIVNDHIKKQKNTRTDKLVTADQKVEFHVNRAKTDYQIFTLNPLWIDFENKPDPGYIDPGQVKGMEKYLEKQHRSHFYTGVSAKAGMIYYPSTTDQFTWSAGFDFGMTLGNFYVETGIDYYDTKERGIYSVELRSLDSVGYFNQVESFEIDPSDPDQIIYNTKEVTVFDSIDHYTHTTPYFKYQYINVPVSFGYKFLNKERFTASVNTGIILSLMMNKNIPEETYYDPDYTIVRIQNNTPVRVDHNLIWKLGVRLNYKMTGSVSLSAEPVFTKYLNSIYDTGKGNSDIKPYSIGLRVGILYGF